MEVVFRWCGKEFCRWWCCCADEESLVQWSLGRGCKKRRKKTRGGKEKQVGRGRNCILRCGRIRSICAMRSEYWGTVQAQGGWVLTGSRTKAVASCRWRISGVGKKVS